MGFFEDLGKKASETYKSAADKTSKISKELKLKSTINDDKNKIKELYEEIGKKMYEKHVEDEDFNKQEIEDECSKIDAYAREIEDLSKEIAALKDMKKCVSCSKEIKTDASFCPFCGAKQAPANTAIDVAAEEVTVEVKDTDSENSEQSNDEENKTEN